MANIGQIVYRVEDYMGYYGTKVSTNKDLTDLVEAGDDNEIDPYSNIFTNVSGTITKVSMQAPAGTQFKINGSKSLIMGKTGIYEADEAITITSLQLVAVPIYVLDEDASAEAITNGKAAMAAATTKYEAAIAGVTDYATLQSAIATYDTEYTAGYQTYKNGVNGIYVEGTTSVEDKNIIVDYIYTGGATA